MSLVIVMIAHQFMFRDLELEGALALVLKSAVVNLVQTVTGRSAVHGGPFAILSWMQLCFSDWHSSAAADYTVTEAGFGADLGAEKMDIELERQHSQTQSSLYLYIALKMNGGVAKDALTKRMLRRSELVC